MQAHYGTRSAMKQNLSDPSEIKKSLNASATLSHKKDAVSKFNDIIQEEKHSHETRQPSNGSELSTTGTNSLGRSMSHQNSNIFFSKPSDVRNSQVRDSQMDIETEGTVGSPKYNDYGFVQTEMRFDSEENFFSNTDDFQKSLENFSDAPVSRAESSEVVVKFEANSEEAKIEPGYGMVPAAALQKGFNYNYLPFLPFQRDLLPNPFLFTPMKNDQLLKKLELNTSPSVNGNSSMKKRPGKNPFSEPKDVGRHFLKVHMKKCMHHVLKNMDGVYEALRSYFFDDLEEPAAMHPQQMQQFLLKMTMEFREWLETLRKIFKDYGKEDFKTAYLINSKQLGKEIYELEDYEIPKFLTGRPNDWNRTAFKEVMRRVSLNFIRDLSEKGLRYQLVNANNILVEEEHLRYVYLTEWLVDKPSRIENSEIFGKMWVENFFKSKKLL